jgi:hypothetical protein
MKKRIFNWTLSQEYGEYGWLEDNAPDTFEPARARVLAHDILEHLPCFNRYTGWANELLALGAMIFIRGEPGYFCQNKIWEKRWEIHLGADLSMMLERLTYDKDVKIPYLKANRLDNELEEYLDIAINTAIEHAAEVTKLPIDRNIIKAYLRKGYRKARQVYKQGWLACELFRRIEQQAEQLSKHAGEWQQLHVELCIKRFTVNMYITSGLKYD